MLKKARGEDKPQPNSIAGAKNFVFEVKSSTALSLIGDARDCNGTKPEKTKKRNFFTLTDFGRRRVQRSVSTSNLDAHDDGGEEERLRGLQSHAATMRKPASCLKRTSSYGDMIGTNIPIAQERKAWKALPKPSFTVGGASVPNKNPKMKWKLRRTLSDTSAIFLDTIGVSTNESSGSEKRAQGTVYSDSTDSDDGKAAHFTMDDQEPEFPIVVASTAVVPPVRKIKKSVSFTCLEFREYETTIGDNPSCRTGVPIALDWTYKKESEVVGVLQYEAAKAVAKRNTYGKEEGIKRLSSKQRQNMLGKEEYLSSNELQLVAKRVKRIQEFTQRYLSARPIMKAEDALESVQRKAKRMVRRVTSKDDLTNLQ